jgi:peptidase E
MELLLLSNSTLPGKAWLEHALPLIAGQVKAAVGGIHPLRWRDAILG